MLRDTQDVWDTTVGWDPMREATGTLFHLFPQQALLRPEPRHAQSPSCTLARKSPTVDFHLPLHLPWGIVQSKSTPGKEQASTRPGKQPWAFLWDDRPGQAVALPLPLHGYNFLSL